MAGDLAAGINQTAPADNELRTGTVASLVNPDTGQADGIYVRFTADSSAKPSRCSSLTGYTPLVGDVVQVLRQEQQFLILGVAAQLGVPWTQITPLAGWTVAGGGPVFQFAIDTTRKRIYVEGELTGGTNTNGTTIGNITMPVAQNKRSTRAIAVNALPAAGAFAPLLQLVPSGVGTGALLTIFGCTSATTLYIDVSYPYTTA